MEISDPGLGDTQHKGKPASGNPSEGRLPSIKGQTCRSTDGINSTLQGSPDQGKRESVRVPEIKTKPKKPEKEGQKSERTGTGSWDGGGY